MSERNNESMYNFARYCTQDRWASYWQQIDEILRCRPRNVLEIGVGDKVVGDYLKNNTGIEYTGLDIDAGLRPEIVAGIEKMPLAQNSFDAVCAFEVLEHLPYEKFTAILRELRRVSRQYVLISLPHWGRHYALAARLPYFGKRGAQYKFNFFAPRHEFNGQHYWEIGEKGYAVKKIKRDIEGAGFRIVRDYIIFESPYHHFFVLSLSEKG